MHLDQRSAECLVFTRAAGMLSGLGHDLKLRVGRFVATVDDASGAVDAELDPASLRVVCAMRGDAEAPDTLGAGDARTIEATIADEVLESARHPSIRFHAPGPPRAGAGVAGLAIAGTLELHGRSRPVTLHASRQGDRYVAEARLHQPDFGIRPYSAMLGALRVAPDVIVRIAMPLAG